MVERASLEREERAAAIAAAGGIEPALRSGALPRRLDLTLCEAVLLGLLRQQVRTFVGVLGHGTTELAETIRAYEQHGLCRLVNVRHETAAAHAAMALRWVTGEKAAVVTSIGPGALHALAGSLAAASDGIGVWHLYGDETMEDEGPNMQQIPRHEQGLYLKLCSVMGPAYSLHTPGAVGAALRAGQSAVDHPFRARPFYLLLPMSTQPALLPEFNLEELPRPVTMRVGAAADDAAIDEAARAIKAACRVVVKIGHGARNAGPELAELLELADGALVHTPIATGIVPYANPRNMTVGGSKGSICGNYAMDNADLLLAVGTRFVCQSDSSRTGYPNVTQIVTIQAEPELANHYGRNIPLLGDAAATLRKLIIRLKEHGASPKPTRSAWLDACTAARRSWEEFKQERYDNPVLYDEAWGREVLSQPAALKAATDWARAAGAVAFFDAGDVQANGFQVVEDDRPGQTFTESGASYMGFAVSALLASSLASEPFYGVAFTGDGSFTMNPQVLIDAAYHRVQGCIVLLDNRRMGAISSLQSAQYGAVHATADGVAVDYQAWAASVPGVLALDGGSSPASLVAALDRARAHRGLAFIHVPVYWGDHPLGGLGAFGRWNVGAWVAPTQALRHELGL